MLHRLSNPSACRRPILSASAYRDSGHRRRSYDLRRLHSSPAPSSAMTVRARRDRDFESSSLGRIAIERPIVLAHMNYARLIAPMDDPGIVEFASAMGPINEIAKSTPGFVWSLDDDDDVENDENENENDSHRRDGGDCVSARRQRDDVECLRDDPLLFPQLSLWHDVDSIRHFAYKSGHAMYYRRRREWFEPHPVGSVYSVCWWHRLALTNDGRDGGPRPPTLSEAFDRCEHLRSNGPTAFAFDFASHADFPMPPSSSSTFDECGMEGKA